MTDKQLCQAGPIIAVLYLLLAVVSHSSRKCHLYRQTQGRSEQIFVLVSIIFSTVASVLNTVTVYKISPDHCISVTSITNIR